MVRLALALLVIVGLRVQAADACTVSDVDLEPGPMGRGLGSIDPQEPVLLPSEPTVLLISHHNVVLVDVEVNGKPVDYDVVPTEHPDRALLRIHADDGELVFHFEAEQYEWSHRYRIVPGLMVEHAAERIAGQVFEGERFPCSADYGPYRHGVLLVMPSTALLYRVEWSDGRVDQFDWWPVLARPEREGLSFIVVGVFADGAQAVLLDSTGYRGPDRLPSGVEEEPDRARRLVSHEDEDDGDEAWMIAAGLAVTCLALGLVLRSRAIAGT